MPAEGDCGDTLPLAVAARLVPGMGGRGGWARAGERTANMEFMFVTLDVSKLTGWLKAAAACQGRKQGMRYRARCCGTGDRKAWG